MKRLLTRSLLLIAVLITSLRLTAAAQEQPVERELQRIQLEARMEHFKQTAMELLETRKNLAMVRDDAQEKELVRRLERLERWQAQLTGEILELAEVVQRGPREAREPREPGEPRDRRRAEAEERVEPAMPQGHFLLELNFEPQGGPRVRTNLEIHGDEIHCVNSSDPRFTGMAGRVRPMGGRRIQVQMRNGHHAATQIWEPAGDGHWRVLEIPDRGENQVAVQVPDERIEMPGH